ncbi:MAG: Fic family protein, partial [Candidatus Electrothrix sp. AR3]|nr:Fic family protein [Candidatus Electrothrix sp. AR3]
MARLIPAEELDVIVQVLAEHPQGLGISALKKALLGHLPHINRRTLQRRLKRLQKEKRIITQGESIALRYKSMPVLIVPAAKTVQEESYIPVSPEGGIIRDLVRQPLIQRKPVGYHRSFLEEYEPGHTFYLSEALRTQFHEMGRTSPGERPAGTYAREILNRLLIDLSWSSSRLEGNTYNRLDTEKLIAFGQKAKGKDLRETQMILNHKAAIEMLIEGADQVDFNPFTFFNLHFYGRLMIED